MADDQTIEMQEPLPLPSEPQRAAADANAVDQSEVKPQRKRGRKPKSAKAAETDDEGEKPAKRTRRTTRATRTTRKKASVHTEEVAETPDATSTPVSSEVAQARALAQISQASVVRRQRRAAEQAAQLIEQGAESFSSNTSTDLMLSTPTSLVPVAVDPALRPHRRGRKPKAYVEAEKAAAAALAAMQPSDQSQTGQTEQPEQPEHTLTQEADDSHESKVADLAPTEEKTLAVDQTPESPSDQTSPEEASEAASEQTVQHVQRNEQPSRKHRTSQQDRRQRQNGRKQRNKERYVPTEPSLSRDDLAAMKVGELREKASGLDINTAGKKKAELVEEIYVAAARAEGFRDIEGILEIAHEGFGHIRAHGYMPSRDDAFVPANLIRASHLRNGDYIEGTCRPMRNNDKFPGLAKIKTINGFDPEEIRDRPKFSDLTPIYPNEPLKMEHGKDSITGRAIDIVAPVGKGQRGLIVSPPKAGKTTILKKICQSISINNPEVHVICLLVDERPEEVTDMQRSIKGEVVASTFDMPADNHTRVSELVIDRAKRLVELGGDVVVVLDSITRLARAYNLAAPASGRILSGGVDSAALYPPKKFLGAARNIENGGSLTILASALVETGSKMDEVIFEEFKGTGNMELKLDRDLADRRIFPAIDPVASGTRNEDLLVDEQMRPFVWGIRRVLASMNNIERSASAFIKGLRSTNSNTEFLIRSAKRANDHASDISL